MLTVFHRALPGVLSMRLSMIKILKYLLFFLTLSPLVSFALPQQNNVPGGVVIIPIQKSGHSVPRATFYGRKVMILDDNSSWKAVIGLSLKAKPGTHELKVSFGSKQQIYTFEIVDKEYEAQYITIKNKRKVNPNTQDMDRIGSERSRILSAKAHWKMKQDIVTRLIQPVEGRFSSPFGLRRFFNKQPRNPHKGLDIAAPTGTPIKAAGDAIVINTGDYFFNGNTVFLDHGQGMITMYCHMNSIDVEEGQNVSQGDFIGTVGETGRVTGPHLHWSIILNNSMVDPLLFFRPIEIAPEE